MSFKKLSLVLLTLTCWIASAQAVAEKQVIIDVYYGGPQIFAFLPSTKNNIKGGSLKLDYSGIGPLGARVDYMFSDHSSVGLDFTYIQSEFDAEWTNGSDRFQGNFKLNRYRFLPRYALHFGGEKLDVFWHVGLGAVYGKMKITTTDPSSNFSYGDISSIKIPFLSLNKPSAMLVSFRTGIGFRYFFTPNIGLNADFGIGGALLTAGVTGKF